LRTRASIQASSARYTLARLILSRLAISVAPRPSVADSFVDRVHFDLEVLPLANADLNKLHRLAIAGWAFEGPSL